MHQAATASAASLWCVLGTSAFAGELGLAYVTSSRKPQTQIQNPEDT
jgi:hypothetical protein